MSSVNHPTKGAAEVYEVCELALPGGPGEVYEGCEPLWRYEGYEVCEPPYPRCPAEVGI